MALLAQQGWRRYRIGGMVLAALTCSIAYGSKPNILMFVFDDMRPTLTPYGEPGASTPNIQQIANQNGATTFENVYVQQAFCGPSRTSFLTGRRPDSTKLYDLGSYWREVAGNFSTFPELIKGAGYTTHSIGKVFHPLSSMKHANHTDDYPYSWSEPGWHPPTQHYKQAPVCPPLAGVQPPLSKKNKTYTNLLCPVDVEAMPGGSLPDIESTDHAIQLLANLTRRTAEEAAPFFIAIGYHKPHIPLKFPAKYLDLHPLDSIRAPPSPTLPALLPHVAYEPWTDVRKRDDIQAIIAQNNVSFPFGALPIKFAKQIRQHYYASISYVDHQLGRVRAALARSPFANNTIIVLFGDHGWQLGERSEWAKYSPCETATRIPLIVSLPPTLTGLDPSPPPPPHRSRALVEAVDIGPTLIDLAGGRVPATCPPNHGNTSAHQPLDCIEGSSFRSLLIHNGGSADDANIGSGGGEDQAWPKMAAFSQYPRPSSEPEMNSDSPSCNDIRVMGYSMRTSDWRYTEWVGFRCVQPKDNTVPKHKHGHIQSQANWSDVYAVELYSHNATSSAMEDVYETRNVADDPRYTQLKRELSAQLREGWRTQ